MRITPMSENFATHCTGQTRNGRLRKSHKDEIMRRSFLSCCAALFLAESFFTVTGCNLPRSANNSPDPQGQRTPGQAAPKSTVSQAPAYDLTAIDNILERAAPRLGGCALLLIKDDKVVYRKSFGRFGADKVVPVASASKWLSGALIMTLVDDGKLSLADTVSKYIHRSEEHT